MKNSIIIPTLKNFIHDFYGEGFKGEIQLWSKTTKKSWHFDKTKVGQIPIIVEGLQSTQDLYLGIATQKTGLPKGSRGGNDTVIEIPFLFADIDFASDKTTNKTYPPNEAKALEILDEFKVKAAFVQNSGGGLHVLFKLSEPIVCKTKADREAAKIFVRNFQQEIYDHFKKHGCEIDILGDLARVFRVPTSNNHKYGDPREVKILRYDPTQTITLTTTHKSKADEQTNQNGETKRKYPPANHAIIAKDCAWYGHVTSEGAAESDEPNWHAAASVTSCCKDGEKIFHDYSAKHPGYKRREAQAKYDSTSKAGPRTCAAIKDDLGNAQFCDECQHLGRIKSPVQLGHGYDPGKVGPIPLGYTNNGNFVIRDQVRQVILIASPQQLLNVQYQLGLVDSGFWSNQFPSEKGLYASLQAGESLLKACRHAGPFDPTKLRGRGVWLEDGQVIENLGTPVRPGLKYIYLCFAPLSINRKAKLEAKRFLKLLQNLPWRNEQDAVLFFGWLAVAPICGALTWRPHCFIYGPPNAGKTTAHNIASDILYPLRVSADGQSTEAGIRQSLGPDALPVIMDEFETGHSQRKQKAVMVLARSASSAESPVLRGTPEGQAIQFAIKTMFLWSAVNVAEMSAADQSRILMLELMAHGNDPQIGKQIEVERAYFSKLGPEWSGYMANLAPQVIEAINLFRAELAGIDSRLRQNMSTLLAGAFVAMKARTPSETEAKEWVGRLMPTIELHGQAHERDDAMECLEHLFGHLVRNGDGADFPLGHYIATELAAVQRGERDNHLRESYRIMATLEIKLYLKDDHEGVLIRNQSPAVDRIYRETRWAGGSWKKALGQISGTFSLDRPQPFPGVTGKHRSVGLPLHLVPEPIANPANKGDI